MPARTPATALTTSTASDPCALLNQHATLIDGTLIDAEIPENGTLRLTQSNGSTFDNSIALFADFIVDGLVVTQQSSPNLNQFAYTAGNVQVDAQQVAVGAGTVSFANGDGSNPRVDIATIDSSGTITVTAGTPAAQPAQPATPSGELLFLVVFVDTGATGSTVGGYTILNVNAPGGLNNVANGTDAGQMLVWNAAIGIWQPDPNVRIVRSLADLPAPVSNEIALVSGITYVIVGTVDLGSNYLTMGTGNYALIGLGGAGVSRIAGAPSVNLINATSSDSVEISGVTIDQQTSRNPFIGVDIGFLRFSKVRFTSTTGQCRRVILNGTFGNVFFEECSFSNMRNGITSGVVGLTIDSLIFESCTYINGDTDFTFFGLGPNDEITSILRFTACRFNVGADQTVIDIDPYAIIPEGGLQIHDCLFRGTGTYVNGATAFSDISDWRGNIGLPQTSIGINYIGSSSSATTIGVAGTFALANIDSATTSFSDLFELTNANRITYYGESPRVFDLWIAASVAVAGAGDRLSIRIYKNGTVYNSIDIGTATAGGTDPTRISTFGVIDLEENDYVELWVTNESDTSAVTVSRVSILIKE